MEFWGVEVKAGETLKVQPGEGKLLHLSQAALGESKKGKGTDSFPIFVKFGDQKLVLGSLNSENIPQLSFDLVFEKEFELSHNWKNGSVYFAGYKNFFADDEEDEDFSDYTDSEDDLPLEAAENGKPAPQVAKPKPAVAKGAAKAEPAKPKVNVVEPTDDSEDDSDDADFEDSDEDMDTADGSDDEEDDSDEDEETPTPKKAVGNKKRQAESETKTPVPAKKAKAATPQKTDGKKGGHTATPHPAKQAAKTPNADKSKTPKSGGDIPCNSCPKTFKSEQAKESHAKAKHSGGK